MMLRRTLGFAILLLATLAASGCRPAIHLEGTDLGASPAPNFRLADENGQPVGMSDLRGRVVVLTFVYTHCQDVCPLIAQRLSQAYDDLGPAAARASWIAISVAPEQDTPASIAAFSKQNGMEGRWRYLTGSRADLEPVWQAYYIGVDPATADSAQLGHSTRVVLIDAQGRQRVNLDADFDPHVLAADVGALQGE